MISSSFPRSSATGRTLGDESTYWRSTAGGHLVVIELKRTEDGGSHGSSGPPLCGNGFLDDL